MFASLTSMNVLLGVVSSGVVIIGGTWGIFEIIVKIITWRDTRKTGKNEFMNRLISIEAQLRNNGGSSLKDSLDRVERDVRDVKNGLSDLKIDQMRLDRSMERHMGLHEGLDL
jgi:hypothetical protein